MWRERLRGQTVFGALIAFGLPVLSSALPTPPVPQNAELHNVTANVNGSAHNATVATHVHKKHLTDHDVILKALTAAGNEYAHREIAAAAKKTIEADTAEEARRQFLHQQAHAEQLEAQKTIQKVLEQQKKRNLKLGLKTGNQNNSTPQSAWERKMKFVEEEEKDKEKELIVQSKLVKEKMTDAQQAKKVVEEMKIKAERVRQEADVSLKIAKEKQDAAEKMVAQEAIAEKKLENLSEEEKVTEKFLAQTRKEEAELQANLKKLREEKVAKQKKDAAERKRKAEEMKKKAHEEAEKAQHDLEAAKHEELAAEEKEKEDVKAKVTNSSALDHKPAERRSDSQQVAVKLNASVAVASSAPQKKDITEEITEDNHQNQTSGAHEVVQDQNAATAEQVKRLLAENAKLQQQKKELETQLEEKKSAGKTGNSTKKEVSKTKAFFLLEENQKLREVTANLKRQLMTQL
eukprot:gnl/MRDRNA2_/MRDRNA2_92709_c0_seq1.p1 gnl/MRDRNA2_/MRDRNA2_92709_c0~~gnl/MRDRNA2_/MRDRNA2_92709_c0_seq1.p1  ORF type:complete len:462 (+),score=174.73 gnl/MRDRNA2_/MRDRNA2_92709_c0_seq1:56-1441(+)